MRKRLNKWGFTIGTAALLFCALKLWAAAAEPGAHWSPDYPKTDISRLLGKEMLTKAEYETLFKQTGCSAYVVDSLRAAGEEEQLFKMQEAFFAQPEIVCTPNSPISAEEHTNLGTQLAALEDGDILLTPCSHTYGWRNGHAALVVDAARGLTLESVVLGEDSCIQSTAKWETYTAVMVLRLRGESSKIRSEVAKNACERLCNVPYGLTIGLLSKKHSEGTPQETHCAHLVWEAFYAFGFDLDSNGGRVVTPRDLAGSPLLEVKQIYGVNPTTLWN